MCQFSSIDGMPTDWHLVHLGSRAVGGAGLVMVEATAISPEGRISPNDSGISTDKQAEAFKRITHFIRGQGAASGGLVLLPETAIPCKARLSDIFCHDNPP